MAVIDDSFETPQASVVARVLPIVIGLLIVAGIGWFIWAQLGTVVGVKKDEPPPVAVNLDVLPPPPPPPPPPPEPQEKPPEPSPEAPTPNPEPSPKPDAPAPMQIDGPAQAGADAFGLSSGKGGGIGAPGGTGTCVGTNCGGVVGGTFSDGFYRRALSDALQREIERNRKLGRMVFSAFFLVTIGPDGRVTKVTLDQSSGDSERDQLLLSTIEGARGLEAPPRSVKFPQRIKVTGKRSVS